METNSLIEINSVVLGLLRRLTTRRKLNHIRLHSMNDGTIRLISECSAASGTRGRISADSDYLVLHYPLQNIRRKVSRLFRLRFSGVRMSGLIRLCVTASVAGCTWSLLSLLRCSSHLRMYVLRSPRVFVRTGSWYPELFHRTHRPHHLPSMNGVCRLH